MSSVISSTKASFREAPYKRIESDIRERIAQGEWAVGVMIPSRRALAGQYGVDPLTIGRAIGGLIDAGLLHAHGGRGTFVRSRGESVVSDVRDSVRSTDDGEGELQPFTAVLGVVASAGESVTNPSNLYNEWIRTVVSSLEQSFSRRGGSTVYVDVHNPITGADMTTKSAVDGLIDRGVDAVAIVFRDYDAPFAYTAQVPVVCVSSAELDCSIPHIFYDNANAGYQAAAHLVEGGCRSFVFLDVAKSHQWIGERLHGVELAIRNLGPANATLDKIAIDENEIDDFEWGTRGGRAAEIYLRRIQESLALRSGPVGVIAANDLTANGFMEALASHGIIAPKDYRIVGFDDHITARARGLTSLRPPLEEMGIEAGRILHQSIVGKPASLQVRLRSTLVARSSSRTGV